MTSEVQARQWSSPSSAAVPANVLVGVRHNVQRLATTVADEKVGTVVEVCTHAWTEPDSRTRPPGSLATRRERVAPVRALVLEAAVSRRFRALNGRRIGLSDDVEAMAARLNV
jgi:hypothetical protein